MGQDLILLESDKNFSICFKKQDFSFVLISKEGKEFKAGKIKSWKFFDKVIILSEISEFSCFRIFLKDKEVFLEDPLSEDKKTFLGCEPTDKENVFEVECGSVEGTLSKHFNILTCEWLK